jgi:D-sedoheptulose 7-phosphate isomerase
LKDIIRHNIEESMDVKKTLLLEMDNIQIIIEAIVEAYRNNRKVLICGNGGSAADAQHFAAELVGRFKMERFGLHAVALTTDTSILTAIGNDYGFEKIFARQVEALGAEGDILVGISTSGNSANVVEAIKVANKKNMTVIALLGGNGGKIKDMADINLTVDSSNTPRIQECHILVIHTICDLVEKALF